MRNRRHDPNRRRFLQRTAVGAVTVPIVGLFGGQQTLAADKPKVDPSSGQAKALNYVHDAGKASDNPAFKEGANCGNCAQWTGGDADWGGCNIFPGKFVARNGWCNAWVKKPS